jgi:hypothetical protein
MTMPRVPAMRARARSPRARPMTIAMILPADQCRAATACRRGRCDRKAVPSVAGSTPRVQPERRIRVRHHAGRRHLKHPPVQPDDSRRSQRVPARKREDPSEHDEDDDEPWPCKYLLLIRCHRRGWRQHVGDRRQPTLTRRVHATTALGTRPLRGRAVGHGSRQNEDTIGVERPQDEADSPSPARPDVEVEDRTRVAPRKENG